MRLPTEPPVAVEPAEDLYAIRRKWGVVAPRPVGARSVPPLIVPPRARPFTEAVVADDFAGALDEQLARQNEDQHVSGHAVPVTEVDRVERRQYCRRVAHVPVLLDTRSGEERRKAARRDGDPVLSVDEEV